MPAVSRLDRSRPGSRLLVEERLREGWAEVLGDVVGCTVGHVVGEHEGIAKSRRAWPGRGLAGQFFQSLRRVFLGVRAAAIGREIDRSKGDARRIREER